ncbi:MAG: S9 family peptidase [Candidatus Cloacimonetes bacterium 4572_55]|nr:MAG: S9 family peptidase [Candidatus Cloacimonetes bacterium 4572_55]
MATISFFIAMLLSLFFAGQIKAEEPVSTSYQTPPSEIVELIDAPLTPHISVSPDRSAMLLLERPTLLTLFDLAQPELKLAGIRFNPHTMGSSRVRYYRKIVLKRTADSVEQPLFNMPENLKASDVQWSPDSRRVAFIHTVENGVELWVIEMETGEAKRLTEPIIHNAYDYPYHWVSDSKTLICKLIPTHRGDPPPEPTLPDGPIIRQNLGEETPGRTYQDLLENPYDESLFEYYFTAQLARVDQDGRIAEIGKKGIIKWSDSSPNGRYLLVKSTHGPFSYAVPAYRFPVKIQVWDIEGKIIKELADLPLADNIPIASGSTRAGRRQFSWRADVPATLIWTEAQDQGDPRIETDVRDKVFSLPEPFDTEPKPLISLSMRYYSIQWGHGDLALVSEVWRKTRQTRTWIIHPDTPRHDPEILFDRSWEDQYNNPGRPMTRPTEFGTRVLLTENHTIYLSCEGASPEGNRPFVDEMDLETRETTRLWRSEAPYYENPVSWMDFEQRLLLTRRESVDEPPNYYIRDLKSGELRELTEFLHPTPQLKDVQKELIRYQRADSVDLNALLYLPPGYDKEKEGPLPMLVWAYPREFKSADAAGQISDSPYRFVRVGYWSPLLWLTQGYAVLSNATMPIIGEGEAEPNDTYVDQLVESAQAAVDEVARRGVADPARIAIGGHSYGAFMAANLLAHSDIFCAGIARSGAYNRTLTPFGFQAEDRTLWEAPQVYIGMSPFMHADKIEEPLLLIHGEADNNSGTYPMQSERFYSAVKGHGGTVRLVMLPYESHGYRARKSVVHGAWEITEWLDRYVKRSR